MVIPWLPSCVGADKVKFSYEPTSSLLSVIDGAGDKDIVKAFEEN